VLLIPLAASIVLGVFGNHRYAAGLNIAATVAAFVASVGLALTVLQHGVIGGLASAFLIDSFNVYLVVLTAFVGMTTALFSAPYMAQEEENGRLGPGRMRLYHASYQGFLFTMQLALTTNNLGVLWVALEGATLATVLLVSLYRTPESVEAAWKYFIICGVGIALARAGRTIRNWPES